ncbi:Xre family transcriptional regulator [Bifidobacterium bifidum]|nr:Xre family transcriptional regulator [Bifidobacterium bifidum]
MLIPGGLSHTDFKRRHPYVEDFYTGEDRSRELRLLVIGIVGGISAILIGIAVTVYADDMLGVSDGWPNAIFLLLCASGVFGFVYCGMRYSLLNINAYNKAAEDDRKEHAGEQDFYDKLTGAVCGIIMMIATLIGLCLLFLSPSCSAR